MKIAVPVTSSNQIDGHFGHCEFYNVITISETKEIVDVQKMESPQGCGCKSNIASVLADAGVTVMLAGGIGNGAINVLNNSGIEVIRGCSGDVTEVVKLYVEGAVADSGSSCQHTHGEGDHQCSH
ncbi:NifB/NifX family molybdenum-iron cluster-binding protein [Labilibaculum antarcticum]|uniref:Dinitrogenase iron-molybdenum cofactor biosynthesis protein n=1 Tax=Labilibaculum antarcticum TaxID=1717717 RepID=A0A1Y1CGC4_9BACT|nr:NifB/NifX family molybdenum-iron cluster-binding protein [Labilibaculum antarcticum]BAX79133.1 dinitrogenase iron-molybdenum cofactor biosynthesis protein [Labilibaculum antarcticum]